MMSVPVTPLTAATTSTQLTGHSLTLHRLAWMVAAAVSLVLFASAIPFEFTGYLASIEARYGEALAVAGVTPTAYALFGGLSNLAIYAVIVLVATIIFWQRSDNRMALIVSGGMLVAGTNLLFGHQLRTPGLAPYLDTPVAQLEALVSVAGVAFECGLFFFLPDGRFVPGWARWPYLLWMVPASAVLLLVPVYDSITLVNLMWMPMLVLGIYAQVYRYQRVADTVQRQQIKWIGTGLVVVSAAFIFDSLVAERLGHLLFGHYPELTRLLLMRMTLDLVFDVSLLVIPISFGVAALRFRLWDADYVLSRSLVYGLLTAFLATLYFVVVLILQETAMMMTGSQQASVVAAASTVIIGALFQPTRQRLKRAIGRRFPQLQISSGTVAVPGDECLTGQRVGVYDILERVGSGGMAEVYRGKHASLNREVAVKVLHRNFATSGEFRARFEREAQTVAALRHPNIVQVYDYGIHDSGSDDHGTGSPENNTEGRGQADALPYMVMEFIRGETLQDVLSARERLPLSEALPLIRALASALDYAHGEGLVHRDVKPSNVMLRGTQAVLTDFGVARLVSGQNMLTQTGVVGTLDYLAPEQITAHQEVDHRADIYAFGVMVYQMLTGRLPFRGETAAAVLFAHLQTPAPDPRGDFAGVPQAAAEAIMRALAKDRNARYESAGAFAAALAE